MAELEADLLGVEAVAQLGIWQRMKVLVTPGGVLLWFLSGDTVVANLDRRSVALMRSYPNHVPLSPAVTERVARHLERYAFDRL